MRAQVSLHQITRNQGNVINSDKSLSLSGTVTFRVTVLQKGDPAELMIDMPFSDVPNYNAAVKQASDHLKEFGISLANAAEFPIL